MKKSTNSCKLFKSCGHTFHHNQTQAASGPECAMRPEEFPQKVIPCDGERTLQKQFCHLRTRLQQSKTYFSDLPQSRAMLCEMMEETRIEADKAKGVLNEREEEVANSIPTHPGRGRMPPMVKCPDDDMLCAVLNILRAIKIHQHEDYIPMIAKWQSVRKLLQRTFPGMTIPSELHLQQRPFPQFYRSIATKFGTAGVPADQVNAMLESEKIACAMLAEDNTRREFTSKGKVKHGIAALAAASSWHKDLQQLAAGKGKPAHRHRTPVLMTIQLKHQRALCAVAAPRTPPSCCVETRMLEMLHCAHLLQLLS